MAEPDGSLSLPYLAGALRDAEFPVRILDISVGPPSDSIENTFFNPTELASGLHRVGLSHERMLQEAEDCDVVGITSIFTP